MQRWSVGSRYLTEWLAVLDDFLADDEALDWDLEDILFSDDGGDPVWVGIE
jgi:hypothetical protein